MKLTLYHYWRSSSSWRVRWALELKRIPHELVTVNLLDDETDRPEHRSRNPMGYVPVLELSDPPHETRSGLCPPRYLTESVAIIEWAEERFPEPTVLPGSPEERAHIRRLSELVNAGIQPLQNPPVYGTYSHDENERKKWCQKWIRQGLTAYDEWIRGSSGRFSVGDEITLADLCLIPQCYAALRFEVELQSEFPVLAKIYENALKTPACQASHPDRYKPDNS